MAGPWFVYSGGDNSTGLSWTTAFTSIPSLIAHGSYVAGDTIYIAKDHVDPTITTNTTLSFKGTVASPDRILCVTRTGSAPVAADLSVMDNPIGSASHAITLTINGFLYSYGLFLQSQFTINVPGTSHVQYHERMKAIWGGGGSSSSRFGPSNSNACTTLKNPTLATDNGNAYMYGGANFWIICDSNHAPFAAPGDAPSQLFAVNGDCTITVIGGDYSAMGSSKSLCSVISAGSVSYRNCKLASGFSLDTSWNNNIAGNLVTVENCSVGGAPISARWRYQGEMTTETTIVRTGGASDGANSFAWKIITNALANPAQPMDTFDGVIWNSDTGSSKTLTVEIGGASGLTNGDVWLEVEYLSDATYQGAVSHISTAPGPLVSNTALTSSSASWDSSPGTKYKLETSFTPQSAGPVRWRVNVGKASSTVYIDPKATLS